jgi:hypothetical protein
MKYADIALSEPRNSPTFISIPRPFSDMRRIFWCSCILFFAILICGCLQPAATPAPVASATLTPAPAETLPPAATTAPAAQKQINVTATKTQTEVIVQYNGGPDAADLLSLNIRINNMNGQNVQRPIANPQIGAQYVFTYRGNADATVVNIVGQFRDGTEQTVLMAYV